MAETGDSDAVGPDVLNPEMGIDVPAAVVDPKIRPDELGMGSVNDEGAKRQERPSPGSGVPSAVKPSDLPMEANDGKEGMSDENAKPIPDPTMAAGPDKVGEATQELKYAGNSDQQDGLEKTAAMDVEGKGGESANVEEEITGERTLDPPVKEANGKTGNESDEDPFADLDDVASMDIYDLSNYTFGKKNQESKSRAMQLMSKTEMADALRKSYDDRGMRRSVGGVILVHVHNFPHILLLQRSDGKGEYALPGGRLRPGESDEEGLRRKLSAKLKPSGQATEDEDQELDIGERLCNWYAIDFQRRYYPYIPAHVTKVKEELHVYTVLLPNKFMFSVPKNLQLVAVPLFELFNNSSTYGDVISAIPPLLSRWHINYC